MLSRLGNALKRWARAGTRAAMVVLVLLGLSSAAEARRSQSLTVNDRIARIRAAAREQAQVPAQAVEKTAGEVQLAQWGNWGNWPNWGNWGNWNNWGNWGNWGNWPNM